MRVRAVLRVRNPSRVTLVPMIQVLTYKTQTSTSEARRSLVCGRLSPTASLNILSHQRPTFVPDCLFPPLIDITSTHAVPCQSLPDIHLSTLVSYHLRLIFGILPCAPRAIHPRASCFRCPRTVRVCNQSRTSFAPTPYPFLRMKLDPPPPCDL